MSERPPPLRICYLAGARSVHTRRWASHFAARGYDVHVVSFDAGDVPGATVHYIPLRAANRAVGFVFAVPHIRRVLRQIEPEILHAHYASSYGIVGALTGFKPLIITAWGSDVLVAPSRSLLLRVAMRWALERANLVTAVADHMAVKMRSTGLCRREVLALPFGVDTTVFHPGRRSGADDIDVICTRPCDPIYNVELLIRSLPIVARYLPSLRCVFVGGGGQEIQMKALASNLGLTRHVDFIGAVPHEEVGEWLGRAKVFVTPALSDGNNISLNEAMACGCVPVCTDIPANQQWITHGRNGFLTPLGRPDVLASHIIDALSPELDRRSIAAENWGLVRERASWTRNAEEMERRYLALQVSEPASHS